MLFPIHLYYNKNFTKEKHFKILNYYHFKFLKEFSEGLPRYFDAVDKKNNKKNIVKKEEGILKKFIFFNSKVIKFIIIDIDSKTTFKNKYEIFEFLGNFEIFPSWVLETEKGFHVGYILKTPIPFTNEIAVNFCKDVLNKLIKLLDGDTAAARLKGRFRNPLLHDTFYTNEEYNLIDLKEGIPDYIINDIYIEHNENKKVHKKIMELKELILKVLNNINYIKNINVGYRNSFLWYMGMIIAKNFQTLPMPTKLKEFEKIKEQIYFYNNNLKKPLDDKEVERIINSIKKYYLKGKIMVGLGNYKNWTNEMKNIYMKQYQKNKGIIKEHRDEKKEKNKNKVLQSIYKLKKENEKLSVRKIASVCGLGKSTVAKYVKELKTDARFACLFEKKK